MKKITMLLLASFFIFSCGNSNTEQKQLEQEEIVDIITAVEDEYAEKIDNIVKTKDFSEIEDLIEANPTNSKYIVVNAIANEKLGQFSVAAYNYDILLNNVDNNFELSSEDLGAIKERKEEVLELIMKNSIDNIRKVIETKDFSEIDKLIEENPSKYGYRLGRAVAKKILGDIEGSNKDYDFVLNNFELSQDEIDLINKQKNSKEDIILESAPND